MTGIAINPGSFRDPAGSVYEADGRIFRTINEIAREQYETVCDSASLDEAVRKGYLIDYSELDKKDWPVGLSEAAYVVEHPRIPYISYPYEWSFSLLKAAAIHHLNFQIDMLDRDISFSDATAYNIQFIGPRPVFIDMLSLRPYRPGEFWLGHRQFCEQFLNPLLLRALIGISHNAWYRGALEGIPTLDIARQLPLTKTISWNVFSHVVLQAKLERGALNSPKQAVEKARSSRKFSKSAYMGFLIQLRNWITKLRPLGTGKTVWGDYANSHTYSSDEASQKAQFVREFAAATKPKTIVDIGCNTGDYTMAALEGGAEYVIGFDFDQNALDLAYSRAVDQDLPFLPLWLDASNPSPDQGWQQLERKGFEKRTRSDAVLALAFEHHLAIAKNIPLAGVIDWLVGIAPTGVIEFVPKNDSTVKEMLALRDDIFADYSRENFEALLSHRSRIVRRSVVSESGRTLFWFDRS